MQKQKLIVSISSGFIWRVLLVGLGIWFLYSVKSVLVLFFLTLIIVSAASPVVDKLEARRVPRAVTTAFIFLLMLLMVVYLFYLIIPIVLEDLRELAKGLPAYLEGINRFFLNIDQLTAGYRLEINLETISENLSNQLANFTSNIFSNTVSFFEGLFNVFVVISLSFYMLVKRDAIKHFLQTIIPHRHQQYAISLADRIQFKMGRWLIGQMAMMVLVFALDYLVLSMLNVPYALVLAIIGGLLEIIPYIGPVIALIPAALVGFTVSPLVGSMVVLFYVFIQQLENYVITPLVMKKAVGLNPVIVILSLLIGGSLAGILGVIIAVPAATALGVFFSDLVNHNSEIEDDLQHSLQ